MCIVRLRCELAPSPIPLASAEISEIEQLLYSGDASIGDLMTNCTLHYECVGCKFDDPMVRACIYVSDCVCACAFV